jgi:hypothetical protein
MTERNAKILIELLSALALVTKRIKKGKPSESVTVFDALYYLAQHQENDTPFNFLFQSFDFR